jgi:ubiquinone/menaquinone biosynthesis C-methylase UbiE
LGQIRERALKDKLPQIETIQRTQLDPKLPESSLDAILVVDAFHEFTNVDTMLSGFYRALKPGGPTRGDRPYGRAGAREPEYMERHIIPQESVIEHTARAGLRLRSFDADFAGPPGESHYYFAVFEKAT